MSHSLRLVQQMGHKYEMDLIIRDTENPIIKNLFFL